MPFPSLITASFALTLASFASDNDQSLAERLKTFYDCYVTGHFRQADSLVAPDSKDAFFDAAKERFRAYAISRINLQNGGDTAEVMLVVDTQFQFGGKSMPIKMPVLAYWKKIDGIWYWNAPVREVSPLPFGNTNTRREAFPKTDRTPGTDLRALQPSRGQPNPGQAVMTALLDKPVLTLSPGKQNGDVTHLRNTSKLPLQFHIELEEIAGVTLTPLEGVVNPGESISLQASASSPSAFNQPNAKHDGYIVIRSGIRLQFYVSIESPQAASAQRSAPDCAALSCLGNRGDERKSGPSTP